MKQSITHLPKTTQEELNVLLELIKHHIDGCCMVVLFGSYARGGYVLWDEKDEFGKHTSFQSDLDIMVVVSRSNVKYIEDRLRSKVIPKYHNIFLHRLHPSPQFIVEYGSTLNSELRRKQYFFTEVVSEGIILFDNKEIELAEPLPLSYVDIKEIAKNEFISNYQSGNVLLKYSGLALEDEKYVDGSFLLHQAVERYYNATNLVFTNYRPKNHKLEELGAMASRVCSDLAQVFLVDTDFEKKCFDLICRAYIEARYNSQFEVSKQEYIYLLERVNVLKELTYSACNKRIEYYDSLIK